MTKIMKDSNLFGERSDDYTEQPVILTSCNDKKVSLHAIWPLIVESTEANDNLFHKLGFYDDGFSYGILDPTVYSKNRIFRMCGSRKASQTKPILRLLGFEDYTEHESRRVDIASTLIQYGVPRDTPRDKMYVIPSADKRLKLSNGSALAKKLGMRKGAGSKMYKAIAPNPDQETPQMFDDDKMDPKKLQKAFRMLQLWFMNEYPEYDTDPMVWRTLGEVVGFQVHNPGLPCPGKTDSDGNPTQHQNNGSFARVNLNPYEFLYDSNKATSPLGTASHTYFIYCHDIACRTSTGGRQLQDRGTIRSRAYYKIMEKQVDDSI